MPWEKYRKIETCSFLIEKKVAKVDKDGIKVLQLNKIY